MEEGFERAPYLPDFALKIKEIGKDYRLPFLLPIKFPIYAPPAIFIAPTLL
ncbi:MAG: hypothetical protein UT20_C0001G0002 [Candidatus Levybacteria bacterium GW2011_GWA1_39_11]|nr:MAG: hypothetical protein UT20_C0001G0002 [Candidatus Levybacteria bacterium GW2011_GWA1_39_11]